MWCGVIEWMQFIGLLMDALGVVFFTMDVLPDFNTHRARTLLWPVKRKFQEILNAGVDSGRVPSDIRLGDSALEMHQYPSESFAMHVHASLSPVNIEEIQRLLRRVEAALNPLGFLDRRNAPFPTDVAGLHKLYAELFSLTDGFDASPGSRNRWPLHWAAGLLILGFFVQAVGSLPSSVVGCVAS